MEYLIIIALLIFSVIVHEVMHGVVAEKLGDSTARDEGRITLNPLPHIDPFGSVLLPLLLMVLQSPVILGAAKPVPVNFANLRDPKKGMMLVSLAGPLSNFVLAVLFVLPIKFGLGNAFTEQIFLQGALVNIVLGTFNLIPIPPLDGSKVLAALAPSRWMYRILDMEKYGFLLVLIFLYLGILNVVLVPIILLFSRLLGVQLL